MDNGLNKRFFTNTFITGSGRQNYLRIDNLEDPLFTSFTFDIDYVTSPLFYTIKYSNYGYPNVDGLANQIEDALTDMYNEYMFEDKGYDILPVLSASILDDNKLGFGIQQNVYMDLPLYGATEYIYMVDKRNGSSAQNDVRFDSNRFLESGGNPNTLNTYKLGDSVKSVVNDSDKEWAQRQKDQNDEVIAECNEVMVKDGVAEKTHTDNKSAMDTLKAECDSASTQKVEGEEKELTEDELVAKINEYKNRGDEFEQFKKKIADWVNGELSRYQNNASSLYTSNPCIRKIVTYDDIAICDDSKKQTYYDELKKLYGANFVYEYILGGDNSFMIRLNKMYNELVTYAHSSGYSSGVKDDNTSFLVDMEKGDGRATVRTSSVISKYKDELKKFELYKEDEGGSFKGKIQAIQMRECPDWLVKLQSGFVDFTKFCISKAKSDDGYKEVSNGDSICGEWSEMIKSLMTFQCDVETSFVEFESDVITKNEDTLAKYEDALDNLRTGLYGYENGSPCDKSNPSSDSLYGKYLKAKETYENDEYSQAEKAKALAESGASEMQYAMMLNEYEQGLIDENYNESVKVDAQPLEVNKNKSITASQTVLDMLGFITGMKKMTMDYPYIIQGITGLDTAYNKHYGIKDPYLGSGDDKITLTCLESLDLRVSSMFNRYFNAVYDRQYRRERVPVNLRRFNCSVYVHDVRNFKPIDRVHKNGEQKVTYNRILELTDMYYSVIEFRFYDCEIVPEETGNIFNDVSNEAPSEMKKTNFTFTYGNCVVNFVPPSEVSKHNYEYLNKDMLNNLRKSGLIK